MIIQVQLYSMIHIETQISCTNQYHSGRQTKLKTTIVKTNALVIMVTPKK